MFPLHSIYRNFWRRWCGARQTYRAYQWDMSQSTLRIKRIACDLVTPYDPQTILDRRSFFQRLNRHCWSVGQDVGQGVPLTAHDPLQGNTLLLFGPAQGLLYTGLQSCTPPHPIMHHPISSVPLFTRWSTH